LVLPVIFCWLTIYQETKDDEKKAKKEKGGRFPLSLPIVIIIFMFCRAYYKSLGIDL